MNQEQLSMFDGAGLAKEGIARAIESAENENEGWVKLAYDFLVKYSRTHKEFMCEDVREASEGIVPVPPSSRAWGGIIRQARKSGLIVKKGYRAVKNPKAHSTPATLWIVSR